LDEENHSASDEDKEWGSGTMSPGRSWARYFDEEGTFEYYDRYDEDNTGTIIVE
jgi:plastocyanin